MENKKFIKAGQIINEQRKENTKQLIYNTIEEWDFQLNGKITQAKLSTISKINKKRIEIHTFIFRLYKRIKS